MNTHSIVPQHAQILLRQFPAVLIVVNTLHPLALVQFVANDFGFHGADPRLAHMLVTGAYPFYMEWTCQQLHMTTRGENAYVVVQLPFLSPWMTVEKENEDKHQRQRQDLMT